MDTRIYRLRFIAATLLLLLTVFCACDNVSDDTDISYESEASDASSHTETSDETGEAHELEIDVIDIPYTGLCGNSVWDMKIFDGHLYIGAGDYDRNYTVNKAYRYSLTLGTWEECGTVPDEQIDRFIELDGTLVIPGCDPTGGWDYGNYYCLENGSFNTYRVLPGGIHCFDIAEYDGTCFYGLGVSGGNYPILVYDASKDKYTQIPLRNKQGALIDTHGVQEIRAYDLIVFGDELYAFIKLDSDIGMYKYTDSEFVFFSDYAHKIIRGGFAYTPMLEKCVYHDDFYFTTGLLYRTDDMKNLTDITPEGTYCVVDVLTYDGRLFVLGNKLLTEGGYTVQVLEMNSDDAFDTVFEFDSILPAMSFEYDGELFYVATGDKNAQTRVDNKIFMIKTHCS